MTDFAQDALWWAAGNLETWRQPAIGGLALVIVGLLFLAHVLWGAE